MTIDPIDGYNLVFPIDLFIVLTVTHKRKGSGDVFRNPV